MVALMKSLILHFFGLSCFSQRGDQHSCQLKGEDSKCVCFFPPQKPATVKAEKKPTKPAFKEKSEQKKAQTKGKKEPKGKQTEEVNKEEIKDKLPEENGEVKHDEYQKHMVTKHD
ncbi:Non-histone chromosomal protein HMG-14 [Varanus komodoensis]|nr:Non-histone chromosomal protein HMG-14 [Varanus komodoensis]